MDILETNLKSHVIFLSEKIGERNYLDTEKLNKAADYIEEKFRSYKCDVKRQPFKAEDKAYYNIEAEVRGTSDKNKIIVIGAHYDTITGTRALMTTQAELPGFLSLQGLFLKSRCRTQSALLLLLWKSLHFSGQRIWGSYVYAESLKKEGLKD